MSRRPMTVGELNSLTRVTPTQLAEEAYEAKLKQRRPMRRGVAGIPLPDPKSVFRKGEDGPLLGDIARAAYRAYAETQIPKAESDRVGAALRELALERFPPADTRGSAGQGTRRFAMS